jgi:hypothetical protein
MDWEIIKNLEKGKKRINGNNKYKFTIKNINRL